MAALHETLGLDAPFPNGYRDPARHEIRAWNERGQFVLFLFRSTYAAKYFLDLMYDPDEPHKWINTETVVTTSGFKIQSPTLEDIVEYKYKGKEDQWEPPIPSINQQRLFAGHASKIEVRTMADSAPEPRAPRAPRTPSAPKPDGLTSLADIATELGLDPRDARKIARSKLEKPAHGWAWPSAMVESIKKALKK